MYMYLLEQLANSDQCVIEPHSGLICLIGPLTETSEIHYWAIKTKAKARVTVIHRKLMGVFVFRV
jgi:hypothetical protein